MNDALRHLLADATDHYNRRDFVEARAALERLTASQCTFADVYNMLGVVYHDGGLFSKAQSALQSALAINPHYTEAALNLAILCNDMGHYEQARAAYRQAMAQCQNNSRQRSTDPFVNGKLANMHAEIAEAYRHASNLSEAAREFRRALELCPTFGDIRTRLADTLMEAGDMAGAALELEQALVDLPRFAAARIKLGICCYSLGKLAEAVKHWSDVLQQEPSNPSAAMYLRMVRAELAKRQLNPAHD